MKKNEKFFERFEDFAKKHKLFKKGERILVGFSGGADSTALMLALWHMKSKFGFSLLAAHVNYNLRGEDSKKDEDFIKQFCFKRNISLVVKDVKVTTESNLENHAREIRFKYFKELKKIYKVNKIALGHNRKDQVETMLYRLFRGTGYTGIKGISPITGNIIHPLLSFSRNDIVEYLNNENINWREDRSNADNTFSRNKIRNELIPWIQEKLNPQVIDKLYNAAEIFTETDDILQELAKRRLLKAQIRHTKNEYRFDIKIICKTRSILRFYLYKEIYSRFQKDSKDFYHSNFEEIESILNSAGSKMISLPHNIKVLKEYNDLIFTDDVSNHEVDVKNVKEITNLRNRLTFEDYRIIMKKLKKMPSKRYPFEDKYTTFIDLDKTAFPLFLRHRQPGDSFIPLGMEHSKKIKDFFIDEKIPKFERDKVLILCDEDKIIWVAGHRIDNRVLTDKSTTNILMVKVEKMAVKKVRAAERIKKR